MPKVEQSVFRAEGSRIIGDVTIGKNSSVWYNAVIRGDENVIRIGEGTNIQDNAVLHVGEDHALTVGNYVTVGHSVILHGCTVGDQTLIGMGSIIMNGAVIGEKCIIGAGSLITQNKVIPDGSLVMGSPAKVVRALTEEEQASCMEDANTYMQLAREQQELL